MIATTIKAAVPTMVRKCRGDRLMLLFTPGGTEGASPWIRAVVSFLTLARTEMLRSQAGGAGPVSNSSVLSDNIGTEERRGECCCFKLALDFSNQLNSR